MKVLIAYYSKYNSTHECAVTLQNNIACDTQLLNLQDDHNDLNFNDFDLIVLGCPVYAGSVHRTFRNFIQKNSDILKAKKLALFILCWEQEKTMDYFIKIYPEEILKNSILTEHFGYKLTLNKLSEFEKGFFQKELNLNTNVSNIKEEKLTSFSDSINKALVQNIQK